MSNAAYFANAQGTIIGPDADFRTVHGDAITNHNSYQCTHGKDRVVLYGKTFRRIMDGDIVIRRQDSSRVISVAISPEGGVSTSKTSSAESQVVQVRKTTQTAEVVGFGGMFTLTTYELVNENDDGFKLVLDCVQKAATSLRSPFLHQLFAFCGPNLSTMIAHNASVAIDPPDEFDLIPHPNDFPPLHQGTVQQLNTAEIVTCVEKSLSDVLCLVASIEGSRIGNLSGYAKHGLLTFGAIIDFNKAGILACLPFTPSLKWFCRMPWRLDFSFCKPGNFKVNLDISWCIPEKDRIQLRNAYLCQSLPFLSDCKDMQDVVYIDEVGFQLKATFQYDPTTSSTPAYLFVPPLPVETINNIQCVQYPFATPLFYWSHDPQGKQIIAEEKQEEFGIPKLEINDLVGSCWMGDRYKFVQEQLMLQNYNLDGRQYAREHGYPELIYGK
ncbi:hypothetical protein PQX77_019458 [Marasmius sp. AFHP31]|nr:hypothetical protein PQX77_019458 [Marasmius sp. AFHP31]